MRHHLVPGTRKLEIAVCSSTVSALSLSIKRNFTVPPFGTSLSSNKTFSPCRSVSPSKKSHVAAANRSSRSTFFVKSHTSRVRRDPPLYISTAGTPLARSNHCARTPFSFTPPLPSSNASFEVVSFSEDFF
jgi:hypothetical protein